MPDAFDIVQPDAPASSGKDAFDAVQPDKTAADFAASDKTPEQQNLASYTSAHPVLGRMFNAAFAAEKAATSPLTSAIKLASPEFGNRVAQAQEQLQPSYGGAGKVGGLVGNLATLPLQAEGGLPAMMATAAVQGAGQERGDIANQRAQGQDVSRSAELLKTLGTGGIDAATILAMGAGGKIGSNALGGTAPGLLNGGLRTIGNMIGQAGGSVAAHGLGNAVNGQSVTQGAGDAALQSIPYSLLSSLTHGNVEAPPAEAGAAGPQQSLFPEGPAEQGTGTVPPMPAAQPQAQPSPGIPLAGEGGRPDISSLRGIGKAYEENLHKITGMDKLQDKQNQLSELSKQMDDTAANRTADIQPRQGPKEPDAFDLIEQQREARKPVPREANAQTASAPTQPAPVNPEQTGEGEIPLAEPQRPALPPGTKPKTERPAEPPQPAPIPFKMEQESATESKYPPAPSGIEPHELAEETTPETPGEAPASNALPFDLKPTDTPAQGATGEQGQLPLAGKEEGVTQPKGTWLDQAQEQARKTANTEAQEKHQGGLADTLRSWWTGKKTASGAIADWTQQAGPALAQLKTVRDQAPSTNTPEGRAVIDKFEQTGKGFGDEIDKHLTQFNTEARQEAEKAGTDTSAWNPNWIKRMAKKPDGMSGPTFQGKLSGAENYLKGRSQPTFEDFHKAITSQGLEPAYDNALDMQMAGISEVHRSAAMGKQIKTMLANRDAMQLKPGEKPPAGWDTTQDLIGTHGANLAVPKGTATAWRNILNRSNGDLMNVMNSMKRLRYVTDSMLARRAISGHIGDILTSGSQNKLANLKTAFQVSRNPELLNEPEYAPAKQAFVEAAQKAGYKNGEFPTSPPASKTLPQQLAHALTTIPRMINRNVTEPLRATSVLNLMDEANEHPEWTDEKRADYIKSGVDTVNRVTGGEHEPTGLPPALDKALSIVSPYWRYKTAAIRQGGNAIKELSQGNFGPAAKGAVGLLLSHALQNTIAQMVETKYNTGTAQAPNSIQDLLMHRTGLKNPDGSDKRANITSALMPLESATYEMLHGEGGKAAGTLIDPAFPRVAESITGRDYQGKPMTPLQRATNVGGAFTFLPSIHDEQGNLNPGGVLNSLSGERPAPKAAERSPAQNFLNDVLSQNAPQRNESPEESANWQKWSQQAATPESFKQNIHGIYQEMAADPNITPKQIAAAFKRWQSAPGLERQVMSPEVGPADLETAWHMASDPEKAAMRPIIMRRMSNVNTDEAAPEEVKGWISLRNQLQAPYNNTQ